MPDLARCVATIALLWLGSAAPVAAQSDVAADSPADTSGTPRAQLLEDALAARKRGDHAAALAIARRAHELKPSASLERFIAESHIRLGQAAEGFVAVNECIDRAETEPESENRNAVLRGCEVWASQLRPNVAQLVVKPNGRRVNISVDGAAVFPDQLRFVTVKREVTLRATREGFAPIVQSVKLSLGDITEFELSWTPAPANPASGKADPAAAPMPAPTSAPAKTVAPPASDSSGPSWTGATLVGVGLVSGLLAGIFHLQANSQFDELEEDCPHRDACPRDDTDARREEIESLDQRALWLTVAGAALVTTGIVWWSVELSQDGDQVALGSTGSSLWLWRRF